MPLVGKASISAGNCISQLEKHEKVHSNPISLRHNGSCSLQPAWLWFALTDSAAAGLTTQFTCIRSEALLRGCLLQQGHAHHVGQAYSTWGQARCKHAVMYAVGPRATAVTNPANPRCALRAGEQGGRQLPLRCRSLLPARQHAYP